MTVLRTTVRRVIVDVVVTDRAGKTVPGLTRQDFSVFEDNEPQQILSFDPFGFAAGMDYVPAGMPAVPVNTFVNLPGTPEKGPLYVLFYDLVNIDRNEDQIFARQQLVRFIQDKPEGTRFAIFVLSDGLHLIQGFTSDKNLLFAAIDPHRSKAHVPKIFLMGQNFGRNDTGTAVWVLNYLAHYLNGLPGRKNLLWISGNFPLALFPSDRESDSFTDAVKKTLDLLARSQIAIYPVDVRGVSIENAHAPSGSTGGGGLVSGSAQKAVASSNAPTIAPGSAPAAGSISPGAGGIGYNMLSSSYMAEDEIARVTGGRAFYSTNDVKTALMEATEDGASYYTLSYAPSSRDYDAKLHQIRLEIAQKGFNLAYRRAYYAFDPNIPSTSGVPHANGRVSPSSDQTTQRKVGDSLDANMQHGAPIAHRLIFGAHLQAMGAPAMGTPQQMAELADEPAFFTTRRRNGTTKPLASVRLQKYVIHYTVMEHQLQSAGKRVTPNLELATAAYDNDGVMLNANVNMATAGDTSPAGERRAYRAEQELYVPTNAATIRVAVRDANTDRIGAMEVSLPLEKETQMSSETE